MADFKVEFVEAWTAGASYDELMGLIARHKQAGLTQFDAYRILGRLWSENEQDDGPETEAQTILSIITERIWYWGIHWPTGIDSEAYNEYRRAREAASDG